MKGSVSDKKGVKKIVPIPPNQQTVNTLFGTDIHSEEEMEDWLSSRRPNLEGKKPSNGEEMSLSRVGTDLYEKVNEYEPHNLFRLYSNSFWRYTFIETPYI